MKPSKSLIDNLMALGAVLVALAGIYGIIYAVILNRLN